MKPSQFVQCGQKSFDNGCLLSSSLRCSLMNDEKKGIFAAVTDEDERILTKQRKIGDVVVQGLTIKRS